MSEMKILYLTPWSPTVLNVGASTRSMFLWRALKDIGAVTTVVFDQGEPLECDSDCDNLIHHAKWFSPYRSKPLTTLQLFVCALFGKLDAAYRSRAELLEEMGLPDQQFDIVVVRYEWTMRRTAAWKIAPAYLDFDDLPEEFFKTCDRGRTRGMAYLKEIFKIRLWQYILLMKCQCAWLSNPIQRVRIPLLGKTTVALPNIAKGPRDGYALRDELMPHLVSVGSWKYPPNVLGVEWFLEKIWPEVHKRHPSLSYWIVGPHLSAELTNKWGKVDGVRIVGFVDDLEEVYSSTLGLVAVVVGGGGTCIKVIEAQCYGCKVFATYDGARGFSTDAKVKSHLDVFADKDEFIEKLDAWVRLSHMDRMSRRKEIVEYAGKRNSAATFFDAVKNAVCDKDCAVESLTTIISTVAIALM